MSGKIKISGSNASQDTLVLLATQQDEAILNSINEAYNSSSSLRLIDIHLGDIPSTTDIEDWLAQPEHAMESSGDSMADSIHHFQMREISGESEDTVAVQTPSAPLKKVLTDLIKSAGVEHTLTVLLPHAAKILHSVLQDYQVCETRLLTLDYFANSYSDTSDQRGAALLSLFTEELRKHSPQIRPETDEPESDYEVIQNILKDLKDHIGHDFSPYSEKLIWRRIHHRMDLKNISDLGEYNALLKRDRGESQQLFQDLLIRVTEFFRDPEAFEALRHKVIQQIGESEDPLRIWVPGCSTGEEAYSMGILLEEHKRTANLDFDYQIFATDIDVEALEIARCGCYSSTSYPQISEDYRKRYFTLQNDALCVNKSLRERILFTRQDALQDPPFTNIDLISCRNLLIYFDSEAQTKIIKQLHFALNPEGHLFLGKADSGLIADTYFELIDQQHHIFKHRPNLNIQLQSPKQARLDALSTIPKNWQRPIPSKVNIKDLHHKLLVTEFAPPSVIINKNNEIIHSAGGIDRLLSFNDGPPSLNLIDVLPTTIRQQVRQSLNRARKEENSLPLFKTIKVIENEETEYLELNIFPVNEPGYSGDLLHIIFRPLPFTMDEFPDYDPNSLDEENRLLVETLEKELDFTERQLQLTVEEYEYSNEQLRESNEELFAMNEQLQVTKEELQSINEELQSVNGELKSKITELNHVNSDLKNLMQATDIATVFLDRELTVQFFTESATEIFNLIKADKGRPIHHLTNYLQYDDLVDDILHVLDHSDIIKRVVTDKFGQSFIARIRPYRNSDESVDGVILTFVNVTALKEAERKITMRAREQEALAKLGHLALQEHDLDTVIQQSIDKLCDVLSLDHVMLLEMDPTSSALSLIGSNTPIEESLQEIAYSASSNWDVNYALKYNEPLVIRNYQNEQRITIMPIAESLDISSGMLIAFGDAIQTYGVLALYSKSPRRFGEHDVNFAQIIANTLGTAIERKRSEIQLADINDQLVEEIERSQKYQRQILKNDVLERWKVGAYLHDDLAQTLVYAQISLDDALAKLKKDGYDLGSEWQDIQEILERGISEVRNLSHEIVPIDVEEDGLGNAFNHLVTRAQKIFKVDCTLDATPIVEDIENTELATNIYRVVQEAIKIAAIHGKAKKINVRLFCSDDEYLTLEIQDSGRSLREIEKQLDDMSINIMRHRMQVLGGTLSIFDADPNSEFTNRMICEIPLVKLTTE
jgi:two-component system CheB/CheR fusion protein